MLYLLIYLSGFALGFLVYYWWQRYRRPAPTKKSPKNLGNVVGGLMGSSEFNTIMANIMDSMTNKNVMSDLGLDDEIPKKD